MRILIAILMCVGLSFTVKADPVDHWPWSMAMPFPWKGIQGTWKGIVDGEMVYFSFRTVQSKNGTNQLEIVQYKACSCEVLASGGGFEEDKVVHGAIVVQGGAMKMIAIGVFSEEVMKYNREEGLSNRARKARTYTVMNVGSSMYGESANYELQKVHSSPFGVCNQRKNRY